MDSSTARAPRAPQPEPVAPAATPGIGPDGGDGRTRDRVTQLLLERGPSTAAALSEALGLSAPAVRRHLEALAAEGAVAEREARPLPGRGRGRPARVFTLTDAGRESFPHAYDDLAVAALRFLRASGGEQAVEAFAAARVAGLEARLRIATSGAATAEDKARAVAATLTADGYAATAAPGPSGVQLCQHHCPVVHVAAEFPQLCEAETRRDLAGAGHARPATGHHRPRRRGLHHAPARVPRDHHPHVRRALRPAAAPGPCPPHGRHHPPTREAFMTTHADEPVLTQDEATIAEMGKYKFGWSDTDTFGANARRGLNEDVVRNISALKSEPQWMLDLRLKGLGLFRKKPMPTWGSDLSGIDFENIKYFVRTSEKQATSWEDLPADIKNTYDRLGIPEAEKQRLVAGVAAQYESEVVYHSIRADLEEKGVLFLDTDTALREHPELFREYFGSVIPVGDNKFAALNTAVWSGGSFIYVPPGVTVDIPLQAYFRINTENMGQFERTLIIADEGSSVHYVEGCTAPIYSSDSLHSAVVEIIVKKNAHVRYTTIQNWSNNVYNLVTKRTAVEAGGRMEWIDGNIGSKVTMKYPACYLLGEHASGETLSVAFAGEGQHQDAGREDGARGAVHHVEHRQQVASPGAAAAPPTAAWSRCRRARSAPSSSVVCDALLVDTISRSRHLPLRRRPRGRRLRWGTRRR